ncbi:MAG: rod shape-determining protein RodA [Acidobacteriota bacterium]|nr:rod shape-determining protein RodA [Acidobacteriota bacterium]
MIFRERTSTAIDLNFLGTAIVLAMIGCLLVYSATFFNEPNLNTFKKQMLWVLIGIVLAIVIMMIDYHILFDIAPILYIIGIVLLIYLLIWGRVTANVNSWIHIAGFQFQPSEFMKVFTALMLARFFDSNDRAYLDFRSFMIAMGIIGLPVGLIIVQPDFGTAAAFFPLVAVAMFFGGIRPRIWLAMILAVVVSLPLAWSFFLKPYQKERVIIFLNPERDPRGDGYQMIQAKIAIGSGGIHGKGFTHGTQGKLGFVPEHHTDFIFSVLGEEWGFVGVIVVLGLYLYLVFQALTFAKHARDRGGTFLVICLTMFFVFHILINVSMQIGILPTTGIPLPLISYGGSSTMMFFIAVGLIANVDLRRFVNS